MLLRPVADFLLSSLFILFYIIRSTTHSWMRVKAESMEEGPFPSYVQGGMGVLERRRITMASDTSEALGEIGSASEQLLCNLESCASFVLHRSINPRQAAGQIAKVQLGKTI